MSREDSPEEGITELSGSHVKVEERKREEIREREKAELNYKARDFYFLDIVRAKY